jgi:hypothetical protein
VAGPEASQQATIDWRRLAADKNVAIDVARGLWEQAKAAAADPVTRSTLFRRLLDDAAKDPGAAQEPGRSTLVNAKGPEDPTSLGAGKTTLVLLEAQRSGATANPADATNEAAPAQGKDATAAKDAATAAPGGDANKKDEPPTAPPTVNKLRDDLVAAAEATQDAAALLATVDAATIVEALKQLRAGSPTILQKVLTVAGAAIERMLGQQLPDPTQAQAGGPVGISVPIVTMDGVETQTIRDDGAPMINDMTVAEKVSQWVADIQKRTAAEQEAATPTLARAAALDQTAADQAKKTKLGDEAAKAALPDTQRQLGATLGTISREVQQQPSTSDGLDRAAAPADAGAQPQAEVTAAEPIVTPTSMAGTPHTLVADPAAGKVELNSIKDYAVEKLESVVSLVPDGVRVYLTNAISVAVETAAIVVDPALKPGARPSDRLLVVQRLGDKMKDLSVAIRLFGDRGKFRDANPVAVKLAREEEKKQQEAMAQAAAAPPAHADAPASPTANASATAADVGSPTAGNADAPATAAAPTAPGAPAVPVDKDAGAAPAAKDAAAPAAPPDKDAAPADQGAAAADKDTAPADKDAASADKDLAAPTPAPPNVAAPAGPAPPLTQAAYNEHIRLRFVAEIAELDRLAAEFKARDRDGAREHQKLVLTLEEIEALENNLAAIKAKFEQAKAAGTLKPDEIKMQEKAIQGQEKGIAAQQAILDFQLDGKTMPELRKEAEKLIVSVQAKGADATKAKENLEAVMNASILLGTQIDKKSAEAGRTLYDKEIDKKENPALLEQGRAAGMSEAELAEMAVNYRNWGKEWMRREIMRDENHREILFLRDLGTYGNKNGLTPKQVMDKEIKKLPLSKETKEAALSGDYSVLTTEQMNQIHAAMIGSAATPNAGVSANSGVKDDMPGSPAAASPVAAGAPTSPIATPSVAAIPAPPIAQTVAPAPIAAPAPTAAPSIEPAGNDPGSAPAADAGMADTKADPAADAGMADTKADPAADGGMADARVDVPAGNDADVAPPEPMPTAPAAAPAESTALTAPGASSTEAPAEASTAAPTTATAAPTEATAATAVPTVAAPAAPTAETAAPTEAAKPEEPAHTPAQTKAEVASITNATIPQGKGEPAAKLTLDDPPSMVIRSDSPDPIRLKDELITLTKEYLALDSRTENPPSKAERDKKLGDIRAKFEALRAAMAFARGEDSQLTMVRTRFEKFIGVKATSNAWPQGHDGLNRMATQAKLMIVESKTKAQADAKSVDAKLQELAADPKWKKAIGEKLGTNINVGFAGAVSKEFDAVINALTSGSMVQKAQTLINFAENFLTKAMMGPESALIMKRVRENIEATQKEAAEEAARLGHEPPPDFQLAKREENAGKMKPVKGLMSQPEFLDKMDALKQQNKGVDDQRQQVEMVDAQAVPRRPLDNKSKVSSDNTHLGGDMDSKTPQQPVELLNEAQLNFLANQGQPKVDFTECDREADPEKRRLAKVAALKAAGIHLSKAPGHIPDEQGGGVWPPYGQGAPPDAKEPARDTAGMVDATSIVPDADRAVADQITVTDKESGKDQTYIEGKAENIVDPMHTWIAQARAAHAPLKAGISGTTARFAGAAQMLGATKHQAVVAMIGHLQAIEAHSFWEIVDGACLAMQPGKYTPFAPNPEGMETAGAEFVKTHVHNIGPDDAIKKKKVILGEE